LLTAEKALYMNVRTRVAMLSFSNFAARSIFDGKSSEGSRDYQKESANLVVEGEIMRDTA